MKFTGFQPYTVTMVTKAHTGFTLIEMMLTVLLLAVVFAIGIPGFQNSARNARMTSSVNELITAMQLARSEAVKRRGPVVLCVGVADGTPDEGCDVSGSWADGWIVFADADNSGTLTDGDEVVLRRGALTETGTIQTLTATTDQIADAIVYDPSGFPRPYADGTSGGVILFCDDRASDAVARVIGVSQTGRPAVGGIDRLPSGVDLTCE